RPCPTVPHDHASTPHARFRRRCGISDARRAAAVRSGVRAHRRRSGYGNGAAVALCVHRVDAAPPLRLRICAVGHRIPAHVCLCPRVVTRARTLADRSSIVTARPVVVGLAVAGALFVAALLFPIYWMVVASLTPESRLFEGRPLLPAAGRLEP